MKNIKPKEAKYLRKKGWSLVRETKHGSIWRDSSGHQIQLSQEKLNMAVFGEILQAIKFNFHTLLEHQGL